MSVDRNGVMNFRGKDYFTVARRVADFRAAHTIADGWGILTSVVTLDAEVVVFRAAVVDPNGREVAVGFAEEKRSSRGVNSTSALENCETSAIGRALAAAGWGGDGEYASADELANALTQQRQGGGQEPPGKPAPIDAFRSGLVKLGADLGALEQTRQSEGWDAFSTWSRQGLRDLYGRVSRGEYPEVYNPPQPTPAR